jgi:hypothetical protein
VQGSLLIHGQGTVYGASGSAVAIAVKASQSANFPIEIKNTGTAPAAYNLTVDLAKNCFNATLPNCTPGTLALSTGGVNVTSLTLSANGYQTASIAAGKTAALNLRASMPYGDAPDAQFLYVIYLSDTSGKQLAQDIASVNYAASTGTYADDEFVSAFGESPVAGGDAEPIVSGPVRDLTTSTSPNYDNLELVTDPGAS